jgi:hypothetical protein
MNKKNLIIVSLLCWGNIGFFYLLYLLKFEPVLVGVFRELTLIPSFLGGVICLVLLTYVLLKEKFS